MSLDPVWIVETADGAALGYATPVTGLTVTVQGVSSTISSIGASSVTLADGRVIYSGQHPGAWLRVLRSDLNAQRGPDWPTATGDVEVQGNDNSGTQTLSKITYVNGDGSTATE